MFERKKQAGKIYFLPIDQIRPSPFQARREFSEQELAALAQSIRENGLLQPVTVRKLSESAKSFCTGSGCGYRRPAGAGCGSHGIHRPAF